MTDNGPFCPVAALSGMADTRDAGCIGKGEVESSILRGSTTKTPFHRTTWRRPDKWPTRLIGDFWALFWAQIGGRMARKKVHGSEVRACSCGAKFTDYAKEAVHRHNFPALCRKKPVRKKPASPAASAEHRPDAG